MPREKKKNNNYDFNLEEGIETEKKKQNKKKTYEYQNQWNKCLSLTIRVLKNNFTKLLKYTLRHLIMIIMPLPFKDPF